MTFRDRTTTKKTDVLLSERTIGESQHIRKICLNFYFILNNTFEKKTTTTKKKSDFVPTTQYSQMKKKNY